VFISWLVYAAPKPDVFWLTGIELLFLKAFFVMIHAWQIELSKCFGHISRLHTNIFRNN